MRLIPIEEHPTIYLKTVKVIKNKHKTIKKMVIGTYISIITLNVNGLNAPKKDTGWLNGNKNKTCIYATYKRPTSDLGKHTN